MPSLRSSSLREPPPRLLAIRRAAGLLQSKPTSSGDGRSKAWLFFLFIMQKMISRQTSLVTETTWGSQSFSRPRLFCKLRTEHLVCILTAAGPGQSPLPTLPGSLSRPPTLQSQAEYFLPAAQLVRWEVKTRFIFAESEQAHLWGQLPALPRVPSRMPLTTFNVI